MVDTVILNRAAYQAEVTAQEGCLAGDMDIPRQEDIVIPQGDTDIPRQGVHAPVAAVVTDIQQVAACLEVGLPIPNPAIHLAATLTATHLLAATVTATHLLAVYLVAVMDKTNLLYITQRIFTTITMLRPSRSPTVLTAVVHRNTTRCIMVHPRITFTNTKTLEVNTVHC